MLKRLLQILSQGPAPVAAYRKVRAMNAEVRAHACPRCEEPLGIKRPGRITWTQRMWGGWTCPECGCDVDRFGNERKK
jgi:hypothetical protein